MAGGAPYLSPDLWSLFPDSLDDQGKPEGWETFSLGQIAEHHTKTLTPAKMAESEVEHFSLPAYDKGQIPAIDHGASIKSNKTLVPAEAVLLSKLNPEIPRVWMPETHSRLQQVSSTEFLAYTAKVGAGRSLLFCLFSDQGLGSSFKCNTQSPLGIGCCDGHTKQAPQQRGTWRDISRA